MWTDFTAVDHGQPLYDMTVLCYREFLQGFLCSFKLLDLLGKQLIAKTHFTPIIHEKSVSRFLRAFSMGKEKKKKEKE